MGFKPRVVFGDFQTPPALAEAVVAAVARLGVLPSSVVEPSCGRGSILAAARARFSGAALIGLDINKTHLRACRQAVGAAATLHHKDFFATDWDALLAPLAEPLLVVGNPPWVTTAALAVAAGDNAPTRDATGLSGIEAVTGRANFDISEWMLRQLAERICTRDATLAMVCKTAVARKLLAHLWSHDSAPRDARMFCIDAAAAFGAAVDACVLVCRFGSGAGAHSCAVYPSLDATVARSELAYRDGELIADVGCYERTRHLLGKTARWRSGIKHDCSKVVELRADQDGLRNGLGEVVDLEPDYLFPMLKSAELARGVAPRRLMLVPQRHTSEPTDVIAGRAPKTWRYLQRHRARFAARASTIYRNRAAFAVFGVGDYAFTPWKVAVSGFYEPPTFRVIGPAGGRPVVFDDTCYVLPCSDRAQAERRARALNSPLAAEFFRAYVFADNKRPITARLLSRLDVDALG